ncbi:MAG: transcriptional regulator [Actinobacteria bacterium]|nr:transcriptional regulator [Actinomycetota bacterium]
MTDRTTVKCLTIVAEAVLEQRLINDLRLAGASGWTLTSAQGAGPRTRRVSEAGGGNVRVEVLATAEVVDRMWSALRERYFPQYAVVAWEYDVKVERGELFGS